MSPGSVPVPTDDQPQDRCLARSAAGLSLTAAQVIERLSLRAHPEGGHFRETWRDAVPGGTRGAGTAIYFLLAAGESSRWHRVDATEIWHWYAGAPLDLGIASPGAMPEWRRLGPDLLAGELPQQIVPPHAWQSARSTGAWTLVGCTVSPAFEFDGFELAPPGWEPGAGTR
jgi:predicted cupin superfamily sugar epimerase